MSGVGSSNLRKQNAALNQGQPAEGVFYVWRLREVFGSSNLRKQNAALNQGQPAEGVFYVWRLREVYGNIKQRMRWMQTSPVRINWQLMKNVQKLHRFLYAIGLGPLIGRVILLLTTTGRKTGAKRVTPLQYEEIDGLVYLAAARGQKADWVRNIQADSHVEVRIKTSKFPGEAEVVTDPVRITDFLEYRLQSHPRMIGMMMKMHHMPPHPSRAQLEELAGSLTMVVIHPIRAET